VTSFSLQTPECRVLRPHLTTPSAAGYDCTVVLLRDDIHHVWEAIMQAAKFWRASKYRLRRQLISHPLFQLPREESVKLPLSYSDAYFMRLTSPTAPTVLDTANNVIAPDQVLTGSLVECACTFVPTESDEDRLSIAVELEWIELRESSPPDVHIWQRVPYYGQEFAK
jgi:hypothetical protein